MIPKELEQQKFVLLKQKSKIPIEKEWQNKPKSYYEAIEHLKKGENYGILCGNGLIIIDCDNSLLTKDVMTKLPLTFAVETGSGNHHFYYNCDLDKKIVLSKGNLHLGEIQSTGSQAVGPGSTHPNGNTYKVIANRPIATLKKEDLEVFKKYFSGTEQVKEQNKTLDNTRSGIEFREVKKNIRKGWSKEKIFKHMTAFEKWNRQGPAYQEHTYKNALKVVEKQNQHQLPEVIPANQLYEKEFPPITWVAEGLAILGGITYVTGEPKTYKTRFVLDMAVSSTGNFPFLGNYKTQNLNWLFVDKENGLRTLQSQLKQICKGHGLKTIPNNIYFASVNRLEINKQGIRVLKELIRIHKINVLVLDPFVSFVEGDENSSKDVREMHDNLAELKEMNIGIIIPHHFNKQGQYRGSSDIPANSDVQLSLSKKHINVVGVTTTHNRHVTPEDFVNFEMEVEGNTNDYMRFKWLGQPEHNTSLRNQVVDKIELYILKNPDVKKFKKKQITNDIVVANNFAKGKAADNLCGKALEKLVYDRIIRRVINSMGWYEIIGRKEINEKHKNQEQL